MWVAGLLDLVEQMGGEEYRAPFGDEGANQVAHLQDAGRVEAVHRLVEDEQRGIGDQTARDTEALAHAERVGLDAVVGAVSEANAFE